MKILHIGYRNNRVNKCKYLKLYMYLRFGIHNCNILMLDLFEIGINFHYLLKNGYFKSRIKKRRNDNNPNPEGQVHSYEIGKLLVLIGIHVPPF